MYSTNERKLEDFAARYECLHALRPHCLPDDLPHSRLTFFLTLKDRDRNSVSMNYWFVVSNSQSRVQSRDKVNLRRILSVCCVVPSQASTCSMWSLEVTLHCIQVRTGEFSKHVSGVADLVCQVAALGYLAWPGLTSPGRRCAWLTESDAQLFCSSQHVEWQFCCQPIWKMYKDVL